MRALQSLALGKMTQRVLTKEPKTKEIGQFLSPMIVRCFSFLYVSSRLCRVDWIRLNHWRFYSTLI